MKNKELLEKSLGYIGDDLISEAKPFEHSTPINMKKRPRGFAYAGAVAILLILSTLVFSVPLFTQLPTIQTDSPRTNLPPTATSIPSLTILPVEKNFWELDDFRAYTLGYSEAEDETNALKIFSELALAPETFSDLLIDPTDITINVKNNTNIESIIASRYIAYFSPEGTPVFYDTKENKEVDLEKQILGDKAINDYVLSFAYNKAEEMLPGCTKNNKEFFEEFIITYSIKKRTELFSFNSSWDDLDLSFFDELGEEYKALTDKEKRIEVWYAYQDGYTAIASKVHNGNPESDILNDYSYISIMGIDSRNGTCYYAELDLRSQAKGFYKYDITNDTSTKFANMYFVNDGFVFNYSQDGSIIGITSPIVDPGVVLSTNQYDALYRNLILTDSTTDIFGYDGENVRVYKYTEDGEYEYLCYDSENLAASEILFSPDNTVLYYKKHSLKKKDLYCSRLVWYNRLDLYHGDNDIWIFRTINDKDCSAPLTLNGNFVRFIADSSAVVMRKNGKIKVYSLSDGSDITEAASSGTFMGMKEHERFEVIIHDADLYKKNIFTDEVIPFFENVDKYFISSDNAFAFVHKIGDDAITCINIANLEKCRIPITKEIFDAIQKGAELNITFKKEENTLLIAYSFKENNLISNDYSGVDFFNCLTYGKDLDPTRNINKDYNPTVVKDYTLSEKKLNSFRCQAEEILKWGYKNDKYREDDSFNPCNINYHDSLKTVFEKLDIQIDESNYYQNPFLTEFVLYEDDDEKIVLYTSKSWFIYGFWNRELTYHKTQGVNLVYYYKDYVFEFMNPTK